MTHAVTLVRLLPLTFLGRLGVAFVEITIAAVVLSGSVVLGHDLKAWRAWYWDPSTLRYWAVTPSPAATVGPAPAAAPAPIPLATLSLGALPAAPGQSSAAPACRGSTADAELRFARSGPNGAECVWIMQRADGAHVVVAMNGYTDRDLGVIAPPQGTAAVHVYAPTSWSEPVLVVTSADTTTVLVLTWQSRGLIELLRGGGDRVDLAPDTGGWPKVMIYERDGPRLRIYRWNGDAFALYP